MNLESTGGWNRHRVKLMLKGNQIVVVIDECLIRTHDMKDKVLETVYEMARKSKIAVWQRNTGFGGEVERNYVCVKGDFVREYYGL
jgi:hypothetical protein